MNRARWGGEEELWRREDHTMATQAFGDEEEGGVAVPSVLCHCSVRGESGARGMHRALCSLEQPKREATEKDALWRLAVWIWEKMQTA
jgi:hypothetical protein